MPRVDVPPVWFLDPVRHRHLQKLAQETIAIGEYLLFLKAWTAGPERFQLLDEFADYGSWLFAAGEHE